MTWPFRERSLDTTESLLADRLALRTGGVFKPVSRQQALASSAVWACVRLRADLISTLPVDVFRRRPDGTQLEQTKPPVFVTPGGKSVRWTEWVYSTQVDLDTVGNACGLIVARDGLGLPALIELFNMDEVTFIGKGNSITQVRVGSKTYDYSQVWHEKQFTMSGIPVGLSPIAYAAKALSVGLSAQEFAAAWFTNSTVPSGHLRNKNKTLKRAEAARVKAAFKTSVAAGDVWVSGQDWEFNMLSAKGSEAKFLETANMTVVDACRFFGVPGDMIDAETSSGSITYANVTQRNMQLLTMNLAPAITRREEAWSVGLLPQPRYAKLNTNALLRMDLAARLSAHKAAIDARIYPPSRARHIEDWDPLTEDEKAEFAELFPVKGQTPEPPKVEVVK